MSKVKWSPAQKAYRQRFKKAITYARAAMANPRIRRVHEKQAVKAKRVPFRVAVSDYLKGNDLFRKPKKHRSAKRSQKSGRRPSASQPTG